uniref:hypothetical protein n=1 Tax=Acidiphilium multivorum TaxID=62140 RepID=UPI00201625AD|nr:hypothetical protein [Acidiphilium multivorum]
MLRWIIGRDPRQYGLDFGLWTRHVVAELIERNVERLFCVAKATMRTRPIYHSADAAIRGHVFCSFLALTLPPGP